MSIALSVVILSKYICCFRYYVISEMESLSMSLQTEENTPLETAQLSNEFIAKFRREDIVELCYNEPFTHGRMVKPNNEVIYMFY